ncbi:lipid-A-disaccharide synthase [Daejeonella lutea]|uniref:Lipid-A-disaccharide synthase n=1 Tax=Daejeonella lutea TaxID=572036 RepID=A0A1T5ER40_9SPHI|nr:lipid-A-disaccharide synthase [Daejeonella lutea]SKB86411.1 lipid-A-disaccharide synthase [Daejeonella lutea]
MKYYLIAGEASGDLHGSNLMKALKVEDPGAEFRFFGGDLMNAEGGVLAKHYSEMAFMGFVEVVANLNTIFKNIKKAKADILAFKPDVIILIDFPGFNMKIAQFAKVENIKVFYYISPKVWAWNQRRVLKIKKYVDRMFCILPFEIEFYKSWGMDVDYVGNPILDAIAENEPDDQFKITHDLDVRPLIALLPGSRKQELDRVLPEMVKTADLFPEYQFVIAGAPTFKAEDYLPYLDGRQIPVVFNATYNLVRNSKAAVVTSGTATLETALLKTPQIVVYKGNPVSIAIARVVVNIKFISLVNLVMNDSVVKELIQEDCNSKTIAQELDLILHDQLYRTGMLINYDELAEKMGGPGASQRAAALMVEYLRRYPVIGSH